MIWRPDLSQCAGYGTTNFYPDTPYLDAEYYSYSDGSCFFKPTRARFEIALAQPDGSLTNEGTITFDGSGHLDSCGPEGTFSCTQDYDSGIVSID